MKPFSKKPAAGSKPTIGGDSVKPTTKPENKLEVGFSTGGGQITAEQTEKVGIAGGVSTSTTVGGVDITAQAGGEMHASAGAQVTGTYAAATAEVGASAGASVVSTKQVGGATLTNETAVGAQVNASGNASGGWDGRNASATAEVQGGASVSASSTNSVSGGGVTYTNEAHAGASAELYAGGTVQAGKDGASGKAGAEVGASVGVGGSHGIYDKNGNGIQSGAEVSVGAQAGAVVEAGATMNNGVVTLGGTGEVALIGGVEFNASVSVDTKPAQKGIKNVVKDATKVALKIANDKVTTEAAKILAGDPVAIAQNQANLERIAKEQAAAAKAEADRVAAVAKAEADRVAAVAKAEAERVAAEAARIAQEQAAAAQREAERVAAAAAAEAQRVADAAKSTANTVADGAKKVGSTISSGAKKFFSDSRLKENVVKVGEVHGINVYNYNYLGSAVVQRGVMAQELLGTDYADAVEMQDNGFYKVDYDLLPELH